MRTLAELEQLDFAFVDELSAQEQRLGAVEQRLATMEARRGQVPDVVFQRVHDDYLQQCRGLHATVEPLRQRVRQMASELGSLQAQFRLRLEEGRLGLAELEFRHALGEFDASGLAERKRPLLEPQAGLEQALRRVDAAMQKLAHSSTGGEAVAAQRTQETPAHPLPPAAPTPQVAMAAPVLTPRMPEPPPAPAPVPQSPAVPPAIPVGVVPPLPPAVPTPPPVETKPPVRRDATFVFKPGRLLPQSAEAGGEPRTLGMRPILVGSQVGCDVVVADLAPRHVEFRLGRSGFIARDISSDSRGFRINGVASEGEVLLADGDTIDIGPARFVLKA